MIFQPEIFSLFFLYRIKKLITPNNGNFKYRNCVGRNIELLYFKPRPIIQKKIPQELKNVASCKPSMRSRVRKYSTSGRNGCTAIFFFHSERRIGY
jgi:hypothetical protein